MENYEKIEIDRTKPIYNAPDSYREWFASGNGRRHEPDKSTTVLTRDELMGLVAKDSGGGDYELLPEDNHTARCVQIIDIGTQESDYGAKRQCVIGWEIPGELRTYDEAEGEQPAMISKFYTLSLASKSNLRHDLESWRGKAFLPEELAGFDLTHLLGVPCLLQVIHKTGKDGKTRAVIGNISKVPKGIEVPAQILPSRVFDMDERDMNVFAELPEWLQNKIKESNEWKTETGEGEEELSF